MNTPDVSSGIPQQKRADLWAQFFAGCVSHPDVGGVAEAAQCADQMLYEYERRNQVIETIGGADLHFGLPGAEHAPKEHPCPECGRNHHGLSHEAWIESKAGASPPRDWPMPEPPPYPADDEGRAEPSD